VDLNEPIASHIKLIRDARIQKTHLMHQTWDSDDEEERKEAKREVQTRCIAFTPPTAPKDNFDEVEALAHKMHRLDIGDMAYSGCYTCLACLAPATIQGWASPKS
jgi:hypothetical protein